MESTCVQGCHAYARLLSLVQQQYRATSYLHVGTVCWSASPHHADLTSWQVAEAGGAAFAWLEGPDDAYVVGDDPTSVDACLTWLRRQAPAAGVLVVDDQHVVRDRLAAHGYADRPGPCFQQHVVDLADASPVRVPAGYHVRATTRSETAARARCHAASWSDTRPSSMDPAAYGSLQRAPFYRYDLDVVAVAPDETLAAGALLWWDELSGDALVEPVGCVPEHRGRGVAAAAIEGALAAAVRLGARRAVVWPRGDDDYPGPKRLYQSLGFEPGPRTLTYEPARTIK